MCFWLVTGFSYVNFSQGQIFFFLNLDEVWIDSCLTFKTCWLNCEVKGVLEDGNAGNRLTGAHAASEDGCIAGSHLLTAGSVNISNLSQIKSSNFEKWVKQNIVAKLLFFFNNVS
jgi:hypothetical protein